MASNVGISDGKMDHPAHYRLDKTLLHKTSKALLKHIRNTTREEEAQQGSRTLLDSDEPGVDEAIWLVVSTKKHLVTHKRLKPTKVLIPHSLNRSPTLSICLIVPDPQRAFKEVLRHPTTPSPSLSRINRIIDIKKLEKKYYSFESKRQLRSSHDLFLADDRIITYLPKIMGKTFFSSTLKRPIPVCMRPRKAKEERKTRHLPTVKSRKKTDTEPTSILEPSGLMQEIERTLQATMINLSPSSTIAVRVGLASFTPDQLAENVETVMEAMIDKVITKKWSGLKAVHIKGPNSMALPIWLAEEMWEDEAEVLDDVDAAELQSASSGKKRKSATLEEQQLYSARNTRNSDGNIDSIKKRKTATDDSGQEIREQRKLLRDQRKGLREKLHN